MISFDAFLQTNPRVQFFPEYDPTGEHQGIKFNGIKAIAYDGADYNGNPTKIFAHIGFPENTTEPVPAVVLVHGGGGHPEDIWIKKWNEKGYAAISMDTTGFFPTRFIPHLYEGFADGLERELVAPFAEDGYVVGPTNLEMADFDQPIENQWIYHAVSAVILGHNILRSDNRVDRNRIGISGISWGGVVTAITIGYDSRFAFAIPIYGSGYLGCGYSHLNDFFKRPGVQQWFAEKKFEEVTMPVMWLCWNDDCCFSVNSNSMSYLDTKKNNRNTCLSMLHNMKHSHYDGYTPQEGYWFADEVINGRQIPEVTAKYTTNRIFYSCDTAIQSANLFYITDKMHYIKREKYTLNSTFMEKEWQIFPLDPQNHFTELPENAVGKYVEFVLKNGIVLTTPYTE